MAHPSYPANWEELRQQQLQHDNHSCRGCGITAKQLSELGWPPLQVHHINEGPPDYAGPYNREIVGENLLTLCPDCHYGITESVRRQRYRLQPSKQVQLTSTEAAAPTTRDSAPRPAVPLVSDPVAPKQRPINTKKHPDINLFN